MNSFMHDQAIRLRGFERRRCNEAARRLGRPIVIGYLNAARYWGAEVPKDCTLSPDTIHICCASADQRVRAKGVTSHVFRADWHASRREYERFGVAAPEATWAQLAAHVDLGGLITVASCFLRRDKRDKVTTLAALRQYVSDNPKFPGRGKCVKALPLLVEGTDSPPESMLHALLSGSDLGRPAVNHRVEVAGTYLLIDLAYPDCKVGFEYQGAYHADARQMRDDANRLNVLTALGWTIILVTAVDLATKEGRARLMGMARTVVGRQRMLAGYVSAHGMILNKAV